MSRLGDIQRASNNATSVNPGGTTGIYSGPTKDKFGYGTTVPGREFNSGEQDLMEHGYIPEDIFNTIVQMHGGGEQGRIAGRYFLDTKTILNQKELSDNYKELYKIYANEKGAVIIPDDGIDEAFHQAEMGTYDFKLYK